jgi:organic radical activating enzyme
VTGAVLRVAEMFGPTFQGEGPAAGQRAIFVRLSGCPVRCSWCDEPQTWDWSRFDRAAESRPVTAGQILAWADSIPAGLVVITGGEPLAQQHALVELAADLAAGGRRVEIETSGTIAPAPGLVSCVTAFNVSPKLASSRVPRERRIRPDALAALAATGKAVFKFVACGPGDLDEVAELAARFGLAPVWIMPEGVTPERVLAGMRDLADEVLRRGWNLTARTHVLLWGAARGRVCKAASPGVTGAAGSFLPLRLTAAYRPGRRASRGTR